MRTRERELMYALRAAYEEMGEQGRDGLQLMNDWINAEEQGREHAFRSPIQMLRSPFNRVKLPPRELIRAMRAI